MGCTSLSRSGAALLVSSFFSSLLTGSLDLALAPLPMWRERPFALAWDAKDGAATSSSFFLTGSLDLDLPLPKWSGFFMERRVIFLLRGFPPEAATADTASIWSASISSPSWLVASDAAAVLAVVLVSALASACTMIGSFFSLSNNNNGCSSSAVSSFLDSCSWAAGSAMSGCGNCPPFIKALSVVDREGRMLFTLPSSAVGSLIYKVDKEIGTWCE